MNGTWNISAEHREATEDGHLFLSILCVALCMVAPDATAAAEATGVVAQGAASAAPFRMGFSRRIFLDKNPNDARAAVVAWTLAIAKERAISADREARFYDSPEEVFRAMRAAEVDGVTLLLEEYAHVLSEVDTNRLLRPEAGGNISEQYVVLTQEKGAVKRLGELRGHTIALYNSDRMSLAMPWLDVFLLRNGMIGAANGLFGDIVCERKLSTAVLGVFFGQRDACIVTLSGFRSMVELNPQVGSQLRAIETSPPFIPTIFCFRREFQTPQNEQVFDAILHLHESVAGRQILQIFQSDRMVHLSQGELTRSLELLAERERLRREAASGAQKISVGEAP
jgi:ABC-type phosphate/phosphonate transport system substrate-binding protein